MSKSPMLFSALLFLGLTCVLPAKAQDTTATPATTPVPRLPQAASSPHNLVARLNFFDFGRPNSAEPSVPISNGLEATYIYNVNDWLNAGVPLKVGLANFPGASTGQTVLMLDAIGQAQFNRLDGNLIPYAFAGGGFIIEQFQDFHIQMPLGIGLNIKAGNNSFISVQAEYRKAFVADRDGLALGFGWWFKLGTYDQLDDWPLDDLDADGIADEQDLCPEEFGDAATGGCPDLDGDLVADKDDRCVDEPGPPELKGCPDTDGDGIADYEDACPQQAGTPENEGCPLQDRDADGVTDDQDRCPDEAGPKATSGCPDADSDGIADYEDACPQQAGTPENEGCPAATADSDSDGIPDNKDACPQQPGTPEMNGCPDTDGDGIPDNEDACPQQPGLLSLQGCPLQDRDADGIADEQDLCPDEAGPKATSGCPDADSDGIADHEDACPQQPGTPEMGGCPDTDGDGIADHEDACPQQPGTPEMNGCPDTDADGIADRDDLCPQQPGTPEMGGCPDTDGDGIPDNEDACPQQPGLLSLQGCPLQDRDADGIADEQDLCPDEAGPKVTGGCPDADGDTFADKDDLCPDVPGTQKGCPDTDGDGVFDHLDNCPNTPGSALNYGCPDIERADRERLDFAAQAVQFETGKATLKALSYAILDEVVAILKKYPDYEVVIRGHTDNTGSPQANLILSEERARSCYEYLVARGIEPERLSYEGVGEREPIADNSTEEGRRLNRRVEFRLIPRRR